jgi:hypothetical protein
MKFPAYWVRGEAEESGADGSLASSSCWRWSDTSPEEARSSALEAARRIVHKLAAGAPLARYAYGERPLREEILQRFTNDAGQLVAAVTQNAWGALVLNTAGAMFIDVDFPEVAAGAQLRHFVRKWFDKQAASPADELERKSRAKLENFVRDNRAWSLRLYRTHSGLRALATHELFDPAVAATEKTLALLGADPLYVRLCKQQACFRARLTPKPWRCGHTVNTIRWPRETEEEQGRFAAWQARYVERQSRYATCRYLDTFGSGGVHPDVAKVIAVHDQVTRSCEPLALA